MNYKIIKQLEKCGAKQKIISFFDLLLMKKIGKSCNDFIVIDSSFIDYNIDPSLVKVSEIDIKISIEKYQNGNINGKVPVSSPFEISLFDGNYVINDKKIIDVLIENDANSFTKIPHGENIRNLLDSNNKISNYYAERINYKFIKFNSLTFCGNTIALDSNLNCTLDFHHITNSDALSLISLDNENFNEGDICVCDGKIIEWGDEILSDSKASKAYKFVTKAWKQKHFALSQFNESLKEIALSPLVKITDSTINVYWKSIKDAGLYIVELYLLFSKNSDYYSLYKLKTLPVERNENMAIFTNIQSGKYIIRVKAENKQGDTIAFSRGLASWKVGEFGYSECRDWKIDET
jgi:hypothetical protein